ncbi:MAG: hypothetical protein QOE14_367, partial [Humisphaera sp.]|nr:hypothetical protein [Humisphaera sp.]
LANASESATQDIVARRCSLLHFAFARPASQPTLIPNNDLTFNGKIELFAPAVEHLPHGLHDDVTVDRPAGLGLAEGVVEVFELRG